jgi:hypothetical protein
MGLSRRRGETEPLFAPYFGGGGFWIGIPGVDVSGVTHEDRSKSMNSSTFSCGERFPGAGSQVVALGIVLPSVESFAAAPTCKPLKTTRPQYGGEPPSGGATAPTGASNEKYAVGKLVASAESFESVLGS